MDLIDKKILCALDANSRKPISQLAKELRISRNVAAYRIKNLEKEVVRNYVCSINLAALGYMTYKIYLRILSSDLEAGFVDYVLQNSSVIHFLKTQGIFDYSITVISKNIVELDDFLAQLKNRFKGLLKEYIISIVVYSRVFKLDKLLLSNRQSLKFERYSRDRLVVELDNKDKKILNAISQHANMPVLDIAKRTGLTVDVVKYHLKNLEKSVINSFRITFDMQKMGYYLYTFMLKTRVLDKKDEEKIFAWCALKKNVLYYTKRIGVYDFELTVAVANIEELNDITLEIKREFTEIIDQQQVVLNMQLLKLDYYPFSSF